MLRNVQFSLYLPHYLMGGIAGIGLSRVLPPLERRQTKAGPSAPSTPWGSSPPPPPGRSAPRNQACGRVGRIRGAAPAAWGRTHAA